MGLGVWLLISGTTSSNILFVHLRPVPFFKTVINSLPIGSKAVAVNSSDGKIIQFVGRPRRKGKVSHFLKEVRNSLNGIIEFSFVLIVVSIYVM